jgi:hypothetical protein
MQLKVNYGRRRGSFPENPLCTDGHGLDRLPDADSTIDDPDTKGTGP